MLADMENRMAALTKKLDEHIEEVNHYNEEAEARLDKLISAQEINAVNIAQLTEATTGVVEAWTVANGLSKFFRWASSFAIVGVGIVWLKDFIK